jgi:cell shape-determining protein MreC
MDNNDCCKDYKKEYEKVLDELNKVKQENQILKDESNYLKTQLHNIYKHAQQVIKLI